METLRELALILTRNKTKSIEVLDLRNDRESKINDFYYQLTQGRFESDQEAAAYFYDTDKPNSKYRKLKAALKSRMINSLFFIDAKKHSYADRKSAYYECYKDWAAVNILLGKNAYQSCLELCQKILRYAQRYEFTTLTRDVAKVLRLHYGAHLGEPKQYQHYCELFATYEEICRLEDLAEFYYSDLMLQLMNKKDSSAKTQLEAQAINYLAQLKEPMERITSYRLHLYGNLIKLLQSSMIGDFAMVRLRGEEMAIFFEQKPYQAFTPLKIAYYYQLVACTQLGAYQAGKIIADKCLRLLDEGSFNWFKYYELYFLLAMHSEEYEEALRVLQKVSRHPRLKFLPEGAREIWTIFRAYLFYLVKRGQLSSLDSKVLRRFRLGKFINETPIFAKEKRGMNIAILIIQFLHLIEQGRHSIAIDKIESLEKYCTRYLHQVDTLRSYYFLKMLLCMPQAGFRRTQVERRAAKHYDKLRAIPLAEARQPYKIEILPYETLWSLALDSLVSED